MPHRDHRLVVSVDWLAKNASGRTAITRRGLSTPMKAAQKAGLIKPGTTVFDYGEGRGEDVRLLRRRGVHASGWDPEHNPDGKRKTADVVNLGYVINVIASPAERSQTLRAAYRLAKKVLVVSARLKSEEKDTQGTPRGDGVRTGSGSFQKFYTQDELAAYIKRTLKVDPERGGPGIFFVFK